MRSRGRLIRTAAAIVSVLLLIAAAVVYLPAVGWSDDEAAARQRAADYLRAVTGDAEDRGWSLLVDPASGPSDPRRTTEPRWPRRTGPASSGS